MKFAARNPVHVVGTPGTGKSAFGLYLLWFLLKRYPDQAFVYRHGNVTPGFYLRFHRKTFLHPFIHSAFHDSLIVRLLTHNLTTPIWAILDGAAAISTGTPECRQILLVSPRGQNDAAVKGFLKPAITLVNPPWSLDELETVRRHAYKDLVTPNRLFEMFNCWGGVPRIALHWANRIDKIDLLESTIIRAEPDTLFRQAGLAGIDHENVSAAHFHLVPGQKVPDWIDPDDETTEFLTPHTVGQLWLYKH